METERLRTAIRTRAWERALPISERVTELLRPLAAASARAPARAVRQTSDGSKLLRRDMVPLAFLAHEVRRDVRTVERRLEKRGIAVERRGRLVLVDLAAGLAAVASFDRPR